MQAEDVPGDRAGHAGTLVRPLRTPRSPGTGGSDAVLPPDLLEKARQRLATLALLFTVVMLAPSLIALPILHPYRPTLVPLAIRGAMFVLSLVLYLLVRSRRVPTRHVITIGLAYQVLLCLTTTIELELLAVATLGQLLPVPPTLPLLVLFPVLLPARPRHTLIAALAAALSHPFALLSLHALGWVPPPSPVIYLMMTMSSLVAGAAGVIAARVLQGVSAEVVHARRLGSYQLESRIDAGGMGEVWLARHELLARPAAIKLIRPDVEREQQREHIRRRFQREAQATATLTSPHSIRLFDFGATEDGAYYYVMELLDGIDLDDLVQRRGALPQARVIHILLQACDSLEEAHLGGLVHRDIKPSNLFLCRQGTQLDFVKVLDFGLVALMRDGAAPQDTRLTQDKIVGTPEFIAPEMVTGDSGRIDHRIDLYALGCVAFFLLSGRILFARETAMATMAAHTHEPPPRPSALGVEISPALEEIVMACLQKDPAARPESAGALRRQLEALAQEFPWTQEQARCWWAADEVGFLT